MTNPLPTGYRFWIWPKYRLETPKVCVILPNMQGVMFAKLVTRFRQPVPNDEMYHTFYGNSVAVGPTALTAQMSSLRQLLRQYGIKADIRYEYLRDGYVLLDLDECDPEPGMFRERLTPKAGGRHHIRKSTSRATIPVSKKHGCSSMSAAIQEYQG